VLPKDDYSSISDGDLTFAFVYQEVLRYYHLTYPAMSKVFLLNDEATVTSQAAAILHVIAKDSWPRYGYMPRTRELSDGKRTLLERWCRKVIGGGPSTPPALAEADLLALIDFLKGAPHNAAGRHAGVDIGGGQFLSDLFAAPAGLLDYLKNASLVNDTDPAGNKLVVAGKPDESAFYRLIQRTGHPMKPRFALTVPGVGKTGVEIVEAWIRSLPP
jgi:hypothetical protein